MSLYLVVQGYKLVKKIRSLEFLASNFEIKIQQAAVMWPNKPMV